MRRKLLFTWFPIVLFFANGTFAQSVPVVKSLPKLDVGIKLGANFAQLGGDNWESTYQPGIVAGATIGVRKKKMGVQAEFLINTSHYNSTGLLDSLQKGEFRATYFDIPVLFEYRLVGGKLLPKVWLMAGPQFSNLISVKSLNSYENSLANSFKSSSVSGVIGAEVRYFKFTLGYRYIFGLTNVNNIAGATNSWNSHSMQVYLGFRFI